MSILSIVLISLGVIVILLLIIAAFSKSHWSIETETIINKPKQQVFDYLKTLKNSEQYNKWVMTDPNMKKEFRGVDGTEGFIYSWDSTNSQVGKGEQEMTKITEGERIDYEIRFKKPFKGTSYSWLITETVSENKTKVSWVFSSSNTYMMKVMHVAMNLKKLLQKDLQISLRNLKTILESI